MEVSRQVFVLVGEAGRIDADRPKARAVPPVAGSDCDDVEKRAGETPIGADAALEQNLIERPRRARQRGESGMERQLRRLRYGRERRLTMKGRDRQCGRERRAQGRQVVFLGDSRGVSGVEGREVRRRLKQDGRQCGLIRRRLRVLIRNREGLHRLQVGLGVGKRSLGCGNNGRVSRQGGLAEGRGGLLRHLSSLSDEIAEMDFGRARPDREGGSLRQISFGIDAVPDLIRIVSRNGEARQRAAGEIAGMR